MIIATDLDGTLVNGSRDDILKLFSILEQDKYTIVYVTGRDIKNFKKLCKSLYKKDGIRLMLPDYLITLNGAKIYTNKKSTIVPLKRFWIDKNWTKEIREGWSKKLCYEAYRETAKQITFDTDKPAVIDVKYKRSPLYLELCLHNEKVNEVKSTLEEECKKRNLKFNIIVDYLEKNYVDIGIKVLDKIDKYRANLIREMRDEADGLYLMQPSASNKGIAVDYVRKKLGLKKEEVIATGDGGNDLHLLTHGFKSIVLSNAHSKLLLEPISKLSHTEKANLIFTKSGGTKGMLEGFEALGLY